MLPKAQAPASPYSSFTCTGAPYACPSVLLALPAARQHTQLALVWGLPAGGVPACSLSWSEERTAATHCWAAVHRAAP